MNSPTPVLPQGAVVPNFTLPSLMGDMVKRSTYRARKHLALVLLPEVSRAAYDYLLELRAGYAQIREYDGEVLAVIADPTLDAEELAMRLEVPFPLLLDRERAVVTRFLPEAVPMGVFILDRYAALHTQWLLTRPDFPPVAEVADWLRVLDYQCKL